MPTTQPHPQIQCQSIMRRARASIMVLFASAACGSPAQSAAPAAVAIRPARAMPAAERPHLIPDVSVSPADPVKWWDETWRLENRSHDTLVISGWGLSIEIGVDGTW